jgi:CDP-diacylglycerol--serine O-phosphatidyltransferase
MKAHIPNALTSLNLFCGCIAAYLVFNSRVETAAYFIFAAAFFDMMDGMVARKVNANSAMGKELDSLADMVTFGLVPGAILFMMMGQSGLSAYVSDKTAFRLFHFFPFIVTVFSALRLAKFNIDTRQTSSFLGLPVPANTLLILSYPLIMKEFPGMFDAILMNPFVIGALSIISSFLLVSELPLFALKFKTTGFSENKFQYFLILSAIVLLPILRYGAIPILILLYLILSFLEKASQVKS